MGIDYISLAMVHSLSCIWLGILWYKSAEGYETVTLNCDLALALWAWIGNRSKYSLTNDCYLLTARLEFNGEYYFLTISTGQ